MRRQLVIFIIALALTGSLSLIYQNRVLADLVHLYRAPGQAGLQTTLLLSPDNTAASQVELLQAQRVIERRLELLNLPGPSQAVLQDGALEVTLPRHQHTPYIINIISSVGQIQFIDGGKAAPPLGQRVQTGPYSHPDRYIYQALFASQEVETVAPPDAAEGQIFYRLTLAPTAAQRFSEFTRAQPGSYVCMVLDGRVINCSSMYHQAEEVVEILPDLSSGSSVSTTDLGIFLASGPLPAPLRVSTP